MYKFIKTPDPDNRFDHTTIIMKSDMQDMNLYDLLELIEDFIRASGFSLAGLEIKESEDYVKRTIKNDSED